jgi:DNA-binding CsgD family transcriptional regulator
VTPAVVERQVDELRRRCYLGLDTASLRREVLARLRRLVPIDAAFFATVDPETLLFTSVVIEEPLGSATELFLQNEFGQDDVNKFAALARADDAVSSLDGATDGDRRASTRYTEIMAALDLGDELRAALISKGRCWGVICLHRQDSPTGFTPAEVELVRRLAPHIGEGLRRALLLHAATGTGAAAGGPGVVLLNEDLSVSSMNAQAEHWLAELDDGGPSPAEELPLPVYAAARAVVGRPDLNTTIRLRTARGDWVTLYASPMSGPEGARTSLVLEPAAPLHLASLFLDAHGLTPAQSRVAALVLQGRSTRQIVNELTISAHTVQEHLGAVFDKFGIGSRRELVAALLGGHH